MERHKREKECKYKIEMKVLKALQKRNSEL